MTPHYNAIVFDIGGVLIDAAASVGIVARRVLGAVEAKEALIELGVSV